MHDEVSNRNFNLQNIDVFRSCNYELHKMLTFLPVCAIITAIQTKGEF